MLCDTGIFSSAYAGSVRYYAAMLACGKVLLHTRERHHKTPWCAHHCRISGANGEQSLTIPLLKPVAGSSCDLSSLGISEHGDWRRTHWGAVFSAYGKSPFFEYIADDLRAVYENKDLTNLLDFNMAIHRLVVDFLDLPIEIEPIGEIPEDCAGMVDFRGKVGGKKPDKIDFIEDVPYWQVWQDRYGFVADFSIFDLLMTQGRESILILRRMFQNR